MPMSIFHQALEFLSTCNTYGIRATWDAFNQSHQHSYIYPRNARNVVVTSLRVHNLCLSLLGYIPGVSLYSGSIRMITGAILCMATLMVGNRDAEEGIIIGPWYTEALRTGATQIVRGFFEAIGPLGYFVNAELDCGMSVMNFFREGMQKADTAPQHRIRYPNAKHGPLLDPQYPKPLWVLYLA
jgi:hypothetical protein